MPTITATQVMTDFFLALNIYQPGDPLDPTDTTILLRQLNLMIGQWSRDGLTVPAVSRLVFPLLANKGSSTNPYTVGVGGDLNMQRITDQTALVGAGLQLNASTPNPVEISRGVMTNDAWQAERIKDLHSTLFTDVYYRPDYANQLGSLFLWPVPDDLTNSLVLYVKISISTFADLTTIYSVPDGYDEALYMNLIVKAGKFWGRKADADDRADAMHSLATIKRGNTELSDLENDFASIGVANARGLYNIQTGD